jgi:diguanylate cyclase (GGDEF)-like protein
MSEAREPERDRLTGLETRKSLEDRIQRAVAEAGREERIFSLISLDIDRFMVVNESAGHAVGDAVIRDLALTVRDMAGEGAFAARFGGEELVILLPDVEREQAFLLAERMRTSMDAERLHEADSVSVRIKATISCGVAAYPTDGRTTTEILRKVDQALYRAKDTGRNKVCIAQEERMAAKTSHYTLTQLERLGKLASEEGVGEAVLLREALDDLLVKYKVSDIET